MGLSSSTEVRMGVEWVARARMGMVRGYNNKKLSQRKHHLRWLLNQKYKLIWGGGWEKDETFQIEVNYDQGTWIWEQSYVRLIVWLSLNSASVLWLLFLNRLCSSSHLIHIPPPDCPFHCVHIMNDIRITQVPKQEHGLPIHGFLSTIISQVV